MVLGLVTAKVVVASLKNLLLQERRILQYQAVVAVVVISSWMLLVSLVLSLMNYLIASFQPYLLGYLN